MINADDMILISVDDHIAEPDDIFDAHVPDKYKEHAPRVVDEGVGVFQWWYGDVRGRNLGLNAVAGKPPEFFNVDSTGYHEMRAGCYDVDERVRDMNAGGQLAGLNFPNWTGFAGQVLSQGPDRTINLVMVQAYNDWHVDEWCGAHPGRFIPCGLLPMWDADAAADEVRRLATKGCHAVTFSENPEALNLPSIHSGYWDPVFKAACDEGTVLCLHLGSSSRGAQTSSDAPPLVAMTASSVASINSLVEIIWSPLWKNYPDLRFSLTEGDIGWIPYFLSRADHVQRLHTGWARPEFPSGMSSARDVFNKHILVCFIWDQVGVELLHHFNLDNVCWESDYPHSETPWPNAPEYLASTLASLPDDAIRRITHENAMRHYRFDPFVHRPKAECTAAALRAESPDVDTVTRVGRAADQRDIEAWQRIIARRQPATAPR
jgi:predicted TIM-barrel fold metal-dependent hydrolase